VKRTKPEEPNDHCHPENTVLKGKAIQNNIYQSLKGRKKVKEGQRQYEKEKPYQSPKPLPARHYHSHLIAKDEDDH
tara:strand:- start:846 stop:1073 length:228 start_codon:yes stop_codon:yes gene_type:complete